MENETLDHLTRFCFKNQFILNAKTDNLSSELQCIAAHKSSISPHLMLQHEKSPPDAVKYCPSFSSFQRLKINSP